MNTDPLVLHYFLTFKQHTPSVPQYKMCWQVNLAYQNILYLGTEGYFAGKGRTNYT
jgi:hypothetical protein